jgi:hypothetical protein
MNLWEFGAVNKRIFRIGKFSFTFTQTESHAIFSKVRF